jgi:hypothetical protein
LEIDSDPISYTREIVLRSNVMKAAPSHEQRKVNSVVHDVCDPVAADASLTRRPSKPAAGHYAHMRKAGWQG